MRIRYVPALALLLAASAVAAVPQPQQAPAPKASLKAAAPIKADAPIPAGGYVDHSVEVPKGASVIWRITPAPLQRAVNLPPGRLIFGGKAGTTYTVTALVVDFEAKAVTDTDYTFTFASGPTPPVPPFPPNPKPDPTPPKPEPVPAGTITHFVVAEDTTAAGPWRGEILGSPKVEAFYRQLRGTRQGPIHALIDVKAGLPSPEARRFTLAAAGKKLPYLWMLDGPPATGKIVKELECPTASPDAFIAAFDQHVGERAMGLIMEAPKLKWTEFGTTPNTPLIPRTQWPKSRKLSSFLPAVYDQNGKGECASSSACNILEIAAAVQGLTYPKLSAGDLYSRVNGGRDKGSMLEDNLDEVIKNGVAPASMVPYVWNGRKASDAATVAARKKYRAVEAYWCPSFDAAVSASLQGFSVGVGLMWYDNFKPDAAGWLPRKGVCHSRECPGGHAVTCFGIETAADGMVGLWIRNSWSAAWAISGDAIIPESLFTGQVGGYYAVRVVTDPTSVTLREPLRLTEFDRQFALAW